jgi:hypothetical protein
MKLSGVELMLPLRLSVATGVGEAYSRGEEFLRVLGSGCDLGLGSGCELSYLATGVS